LDAEPAEREPFTISKPVDQVIAKPAELDALDPAPPRSEPVLPSGAWGIMGRVTT